ncbi:hypothetical protein KGF56_003783 [Candida oxycetoniae]|uniref:Uncharacterized protein n=1 Tax=Candida oxycetoniae TaxID=497107 RepID=A0AAI9SUV8_9ASCO|nr:uncharacterized protein KGF56_003783 [Candida oxycetoniae]KAI3403362.1 hypothetical protein KGF56_003783 [Candida oxycetoniae]
MKFTTVLALASAVSALRLDQIRLSNEDELIIQDTQYNQPIVVNFQAVNEQEDVDAEDKKDKKTTSTTTSSSSSSSSVTTTSKSSHSTSTTHYVSLSTSKTTYTTTKKHSTSTATKTSTYSITKTGGADAVVAANVGGPLLFALGLLL